MAFKRGCNRCDRGMVFIDAPHRNGQTYHPYMACDCEAGGMVSDHMRAMWKKRDKNGMDSYEGETRFSVRFGSLSGVKRGVAAGPLEPVPRVEDLPDFVQEQAERMGR